MSGVGLAVLLPEREVKGRAAWLIPMLAHRAGWKDELAVWFPSLLAEAARSECAPSMRAVEGNQTALTRNEWKE